MHPSEFEELEEATARHTEELHRLNPRVKKGMPWLVDRTLMLMCTIICMPMAIVNVEGIVSFFAKNAVWVTWHTNPGFQPEGAWYKGIVASGAVPCEAVYDSLDFVGYVVGVLTLVVYMINMIATQWGNVEARETWAGTALDALSVVVWPCAQAFFMLFIGQQLLSKLLVGTSLQKWRPMFDVSDSKDALADVTPEWLVSRLSTAFPPNVLKEFFINYT